MSEIHLCQNPHSPAPTNFCACAGDQRTSTYTEVTCQFCANAIVIFHLSQYTKKKITLSDFCGIIGSSPLVKAAAQRTVDASIMSQMSKYLVW